MREVSKPVTGFEGWYEVTTAGVVFRVRPGCGTNVGKSLRPGIRKDGYAHVVLSRYGQTTDRLVHRIVAEAWLGPRPIDHDINHIDGNKQNNSVSNLEYCTRSANHRHAYRLGLKTMKSFKRAQNGRFIYA